MKEYKEKQRAVGIYQSAYDKLSNIAQKEGRSLVDMLSRIVAEYENK